MYNVPVNINRIYSKVSRISPVKNITGPHVRVRMSHIYDVPGTRVCIIYMYECYRWNSMNRIRSDTGPGITYLKIYTYIFVHLYQFNNGLI